MCFINYGFNDRTGEFKHDGVLYELEIIQQPYEHIVTHMYDKSGQVDDGARTNNFHDFEKFKNVGWSFSEINQGFKDEWREKVDDILNSYDEEFQLYNMAIGYLKSLDNITVKQKVRMHIVESILRWLASDD